MQARLWDVDKDYPTIYNWCKEYTNPRWQSVIPKEVLPKHGVMVIDKEPICASGLFIDDSSKLGFMWGLFSSPKVSKIKLFKAMILCVEEIKNQANKNNLSFVYTITGERALHKLYNNYVKMDICEDNIYSYIMNLKPTKYKILDWIQN